MNHLPVLYGHVVIYKGLRVVQKSCPQLLGRRLKYSPSFNLQAGKGQDTVIARGALRHPSCFDSLGSLSPRRSIAAGGWRGSGAVTIVMMGEDLGREVHPNTVPTGGSWQTTLRTPPPLPRSSLGMELGPRRKGPGLLTLSTENSAQP